MERTESVGTALPMDCEDNVGLSDILDILNTLDNEGTELNAALTPDPPTTCFPRLLLPKPSTQQIQNTQNFQSRILQKPFINIIEQPAGKALRFRYECEGRLAGSIPGINSTPEKKTYPTIEIVGYKGDVVVVVSCVTKDLPHRPHPHNLVGRDGCKNGICTLVINGDPPRVAFSNLGIQCVKKRDIKAALDLRETMQVDPFKTKFGHKDQPSSMDLNAVRLCFQAFLKTNNGFKPLTPVVSDPIYDRKAISNLVICRLCSCAAKVGGGDEIILLCEKVSKDDIKVKFYETNQGKITWEDYAEFQQTDIHKQTAIAFKTPRYHKTDIAEKAKVFLQLVRPSDGVSSEPLPFEFHPDPDQIKRKRLKTGGNPVNILRSELQKCQHLQNVQYQNYFNDVSSSYIKFMNPSSTAEIKIEPALSPQHFGSYRNPYATSPSPQQLSPSPGSVTTLQTNDQSHLCSMPQLSLLNNQKIDLQCDPTLQLYSQVVNGDGPNKTICDESTIESLSLGSHYNHQNGINSLLNYQTITPSTSGGSVIPLWCEDVNTKIRSPILYQNMNIESPAQQNELMQQLQNDDVTVNISAEEGPTLSGLLALVDSEQLLNINSDDLPLSNLSITT